MSIIKPRQVAQQDSATGVAIIKTGEGGHRKIICPNCHQTAAPLQDGSGRVVYRCPRGHTFGSSSM